MAIDDDILIGHFEGTWTPEKLLAEHGPDMCNNKGTVFNDEEKEELRELGFLSDVHRTYTESDICTTCSGKGFTQKNPAPCSNVKYVSYDPVKNILGGMQV